MEPDAVRSDTLDTAEYEAEEVVELRRLFGSPDYFMRIAVADLAAYETFLSRRVMTIPRIKGVKFIFTTGSTAMISGNS